MLLVYILFFTLVGSVFSLIGGIVLLFKQRFALKVSHLLFSFAAGTLLGTAFLDLLPEASKESKEMNIFLWALVGILFFFLVERFINWFHHHHEHPAKNAKPVVPLIILGDSIHNFIDGVVIAASFLVNIPLGIVTALAVAAHEIPQEIGDFAILLRKGVKRKNVLIFNLFSSLSALLGAIITFFLADLVNGILPIVISLTAGFFIYIAASDLIPEIHEEGKGGFAFVESVILVLGVLAIFLFTLIVPGL